ncbi:MAG: purine-nucleoside phosphorylase [Kistimonas sp.]|nr:purine-nucleoside phosphorylase [Kistimonas sp.]
MTTPHIDAPEGAFAETVLVPGDPLRAQFIADTFLERSEQVTGVRNMLGFTGYYQDKRLSVMGVGMGIPSACIYYRELVVEYGVRNLVRVGSCGAVARDLSLGDIVVGMGACTDSGVNRLHFRGYDFAAICDYGLLANLTNVARKQGVAMRVGNLFSSDLFYHPDTELLSLLEQRGILGIEMEAAGLYGVCAEHGVKGLALCTVSDHLHTEERMSPADRELSFEKMVRVALGACVSSPVEHTG